MAQVEFHEYSPYLDGNPSFSSAIKEAVLRGVLGQTNANRLLANTNVAKVLSDSALRDVVSVAEGDGDLPQIRDYINPVLRCPNDFEVAEEIMFQNPNGGPWVRNKVWAIREPLVDEDDGLDGAESIAEGGILVLQNPDFIHCIGAQWPALMPFDLYEKLMNRYNLEDRGDKFILAGVGGLFFRLPLFARLPDDHHNAARNGLRHLRLQAPHKIN